MRNGACKHYHGPGPLGEDNKTRCDANVHLRALAGEPMTGWVARLPCHQANQGPRPCGRYEDPSDAEIAAHKAEIRKAMERMSRTFPLIKAMKEEFRGRGGQKVVECPVCRGQLYMSIAELNGHVWGRCETKGCLAWME